ncbi:MAG: hypothetical protein AB7E65_07015 [Syntrophotalea sp.]|uniref:hypothetical protein n=1 Tax=Syntrophotalea sp. TaxID=2812029 RepID=UPI003D14232D
MTSPGQRRHARVKARLEKLQFYVGCLNNVERSKLAARYLRKVPAEHRPYLLRKLSIAELAFCEVFSRDTYGW